MCCACGGGAAVQQGGGSSAYVFTREYSKATVKMDCKQGKATITMKS